MEKNKNYTINSREYYLRYDIEAVSNIERSTGRPVVELIQAVPTIDTLRVYLASGMFNEDNNKLSVTSGKDIALEIIKQKGIAVAFGDFVEQLLEDCAFLFPGV